MAHRRLANPERVYVRTYTGRCSTLTASASAAYDAVKTPFGERERMLGGAATHFA